MKEGIHPKYEAVKITCSCGNVIQTRSTKTTDFRVDICAACHPFFTGQQKLLDTEGRVEKFNKKYAKKPSASKPSTESKTPSATH